MHYLDETTFSFLLSVAVFLISSVKRRNEFAQYSLLLVFRFQNNQLELSHVHPKKTNAETLLVDGTVVAFFSAVSPPFNQLFWLFFRLKCKVMDPCFVRDYKFSQKFDLIAVKNLQTLDWNILTMLFLLLCEQTRHPFYAPLFHVQIFGQ